MNNAIPPVREDGTIPDDATCQEASPMSYRFYAPCAQPAVAIVYHEKDRRGYYMCLPCTDHNVRNRGGRLIAVRGRDREEEGSGKKPQVASLTGTEQKEER